MTEETPEQRARKRLALSIVSSAGFAVFAAALLVITTASANTLGIALLWGLCGVGAVVLGLWIRRNLRAVRRADDPPTVDQ